MGPKPGHSRYQPVPPSFPKKIASLIASGSRILKVCFSNPDGFDCCWPFDLFFGEITETIHAEFPIVLDCHLTVAWLSEHAEN